MALRLKWSPAAAEDLESIAEYIAKDSPSYAASVVSRFLAMAKNIPLFPESGRVVPEIGDSSIREHIVFSYRLIYRIEPSQITLLTVIHGRRLLTYSLIKTEE
ncbi:MAG: type II toxin-antitoxin system RelE/ParE family toxin [Aminivibrio sp.]|jgi:toxin ParE1/3/4|nr:type II toxin-antitoxin system RelE/ParE family toxin [Synergistaceae bacterium]